MAQLYMQYGTMVLMALLSAVGWVAVRYGLTMIKSQKVKDVFLRLGVELRAAVSKVNDVYVDELRRANQDGKLTAEEKKKAFNMAKAELTSNLGLKGVLHLTKVLGIESLDSWLESHVASMVDSVKAESPKP